MKLKRWIGLLVAGLMLTVSLTGCLGHVFTKAMTVEGVDITAGEYLMMQLISYSEAISLVEDSTVDVLEQTVEDEKAIDWIHNRTEELCRQMVAVELICKERGIELSEENQELLDSDMEYWDSVKEYYEPNGIGKDSLYRYVTWQYLQDQLFDELYKEGGERAPSRDEVAAYYGERYAHLRIMLINTMDMTGADSEFMEEGRAAVDAMVEEIKAGKSISDAALEDLPGIQEIFTPTVVDPEAETPVDELEEELEEEETPEEEVAGGEEGEEEDEEGEVDGIINYYLSFEPDTNGLFTQEFLDEVKAQSVGYVGTYDMTGGIMVYEIIETFETDTEYENVRDGVVQEMMQEDFENWLKETSDAYTVNWVPGAQWYLSPEKIVR